MHRILEPQDVRAWSREQRKAGAIVGFVPTMGALHEGHLSLVDAARRAGAEKVVASIFVNPTQFAPGEDLDAYPRDVEGDLAKLAARGVNCVFLPSVRAMYPNGAQSSVVLDRLPRYLCGLDRPTHFTGVATVVSLLFNIVEPHIAVFGEKDFQQLQVIRQMVRDLWFDVRVVGAPIVRESDGLAMSSRNMYLDTDERHRALCLSRALDCAEQIVMSGVIQSDTILSSMYQVMEKARAKVHYLRIVDEETLEDAQEVTDSTRAMIAAHIGNTRLIDNRRLIV
jgi:pantoate--beta-alanine ligase